MLPLLLVAVVLLPGGAADPLPGCETFKDYSCPGNDVTVPDQLGANRWFTPLKGDDDYIPSFQDYGKLAAHAHVTYLDSSMTSATVEIIAVHKTSPLTLTYVFGGAKQASNTATFRKGQTSGPLELAVEGSDGSSVTLEPVDFRWNVPELKERDGDYEGGQKGAIVEMFGWPHAEIEKECESLGKMGYMGVKIFPAQEQLMSSQPFNGMLNPWYFMYQPVSYRLQGRMGTRDELRRMIATCRSHGVRVYADAVVNHMTGGGNDANRHRNPQAGCTKWPNKTSSMPGGHSPFYTQSYAYEVGKHTGLPPQQEFPAVPYGPTDFHCQRTLGSWNDPLDLNAGWLTGLTDLNTERPNVQERIADYMTDLLGIGLSGFRIDAAKHIKPDDLVGIFSKLRRNLGGKLPEDFISWLEVLLGGEADMLICNSESGYNYGSYLAGALAKAGFSQEEVDAVKTWNSGFPKEPAKGVDGCDIGKSGLRRQAIQNDDADQQNPGSSSRDMQDTGCVLIKGCQKETHRAFEVALFSHPAGSTDNAKDYPIRLLLSSFYWGAGGVQGIPDGKSDCSQCTVDCGGCKGMPFVAAHDPSSTGYNSGDGQYTRVHRDPAIVNAMRAWVGLGPIKASDYAAVAEVAVAQREEMVVV